MYRDFFNLNKEPFHVTPDPEFFFLSASHKEALASIIYGIEQRKGFISIIGEVGLGKTTVLRTYLEQNQADNLKTIYLFNACLSFPNLLKTICQELEVATQATAPFETINQLHEALIAEYQRDRNVVLIIDEAQNMPVATLENLRMLSNLESSKDKLLQIVLIGQPELQEKLNLRALRQLKQRIAIHVELAPLNRAESLAYIEHRLTKAAVQVEPVFTQRALKLIIKAAQGVPRVINILCDNALIAGFGYNRKPVTASIVREVIKDYQAKEPGWSRRRATATAALLTLLVLSGALFIFTVAKGSIPRFSFSSLLGNPGGHRAQDGRQASGRPADKIVHPLPTVSNPIPDKLNYTAPESLPQTAVLYATDRSLGRSWMDAGIAEGKCCSAVSPATHHLLASTSPPATTAQSGDATPHKRIPALLSQAAPVDTGGESQTPAERQVVSQPGVSKPVRRIVKIGDTLNNLIQDVYGFSNTALVQWIKDCNPQIQDVNRILVGTSILFPAYPGTARAHEPRH